MQTPEPGIPAGPLDFLFSPAAPSWAGWVFVVWMALMIGLGTIGIVGARMRLLRPHRGRPDARRSPLRRRTGADRRRRAEAD